MRFSSSLLVSTILTSVAAAQANGLNEHEYGYCGTTSFTSRSTLPAASDGWATQKYAADFERGVCQTVDAAGNTTTRLNAVRVVNQDQNCSTQEWFEVGVFLDDPANPGQPLANFSGPAPSPAVPAITTGVVNMPVSTVLTPCAWIWVITFATPVDGVIPGNQDFHMGMRMPANVNWTNDGISYHISTMTAGTTGDNPSVAALNSNAIFLGTYYLDETLGVVGGGLNDRWHRVWPMSEGAALRMGVDINAASGGGTRGPNPNYGYGGLYPDFSTRGDGLAIDARNYTMASAGTVSGFTMMSFPVQGAGGWNPTPVNPFIPGVNQAGDFVIDLIGFSLLGIAIPSNLTSGFFNQIVVTNGSLTPMAYGTITFQHVALDLANLRLVFSNGRAMLSL
jgi:hypothetical protein